MIDQYEEMHRLRNQVTDKDFDIQLQKVKMKDFETTLIQKNISITKLEQDIEQLKSFRFTNESLKKQIRMREEEVGVLKAKLYLDQIHLSFKIVPEYPDLVEENNTLEYQVEQKDFVIETLTTELKELRS